MKKIRFLDHRASRNIDGCFDEPWAVTANVCLQSGQGSAVARSQRRIWLIVKFRQEYPLKEE